MLQFGSKHVCIEDVHIFKHCHEMTLFLLRIGTYCISCVVQQTSGVKDLSSLVRYESSLAAIRHVCTTTPKYTLPQRLVYLQVLVLHSYTEKHQIQLFGRGHIGGIDIKVNIQKQLGI